MIVRLRQGLPYGAQIGPGGQLYVPSGQLMIAANPEWFRQVYPNVRIITTGERDGQAYVVVDASQWYGYLEQTGGGETPQQPTRPQTTAQPRVSIQNTSRAATDFIVGDAWLVEITGAPANQPVVCEAYQDGKSLGRTTYGRTDGSGHFQLRGTMQLQHIGFWNENWYVGSQLVGSLSFMVRQAPGPSDSPGGGPSDGQNGPTESLSSWVLLAAGIALLFVLVKS